MTGSDATLPSPGGDAGERLGRSARRGSVVTLSSQLVKAAAQFVGLAALSRMVSPEAFGVLAVIVALVTLGELVRDFGLTTAAIQIETLTDKQANNVFWLNCGVGVLLTSLCWVGAPALAELLNEPRLAWPLRATGISFVLLGLQAQFQVQLVRALRFNALAVTDLLAQVLSLTVALTMAALGAEVWALVAQVLALNTALLLMRSSVARWRPGWPSRRAGTRKLVTYGVRLGLAQVLTYGANYADTYAISYRYSAYDLGLYSRAFQLLTLPVNQLLVPLTNVFLPILSRLVSQPTLYLSFLLRWQFLLCSGAVAGFGIAIPLAPDMIALVLGDEWIESATVFRLLAVGGAIQVFSYINYWIFLSKGLLSELLRYNLLTKTSTVVAIAVASSFSVNAVAATYAACLTLSWPINVWWIRRGAPEVDTWRLLRLGGQILAAGVVAAACTWLVRNSGVVVAPLVALIAGIVGFVLTEMVLPGTRSHLLRLSRLGHAVSNPS